MKTLTEYLTNVANSIRKKKQTDELINPQNFATEIDNLAIEILRRNEISRIGVFSRLYKKII